MKPAEFIVVKRSTSSRIENSVQNIVSISNDTYYLLSCLQVNRNSAIYKIASKKRAKILQDLDLFIAEMLKELIKEGVYVPKEETH